ncbi:O-antigen polymerase [Natronococcus pandeyae]|uniref:O-antigen polymerase n=1 Tax=Natronococcus pandeyae TaxID=2055836 RepID=A0A8J8Q8R2_9EURY|nr:O-antigen ligase family protein [Natronococcus pandeyae]TYL39300.1 O-antigen polymerase [Natronococcus pandeyae]
MSTVDREPATLFVHDWSTERIVDGVVYGLFGLHLLLIVFSHATGSVAAWQLATSSIFLGAVLGCRLAADTYQDAEQVRAACLSILGFLFLVLAVIYQSSSPGLGLGSNRPLAISVAFLLILSFLLVVTDARQYTIGQWAAVGCFAVITGIYLAHTLAFHPDSSQSRWPLWAAVVMGSNLFVIPRLVPERIFLWFIPRLAAITVLLGLVTYVSGDYTLWIFEVRQYPDTSPEVAGFETDLVTLQSIFPNPNSLGLLSFVGLVAATVEFHRSIVVRRPLGATVALFLAAICGLGVFLSNARAAMLASAVAVAIYSVYAIGDRLTVPVMVISSTLGVFGLVVGMYVGVIGISSTNRFELWMASLRAIRDGPLLFGYGSGAASAVIEPYLISDMSYGPHNAYLTVIIQTGFVGGLAYLGLVAGSIIAGTINYRTVNVAILSLAVGVAVHQSFESYIMFRWSLGAVLATLAFGYLLFGD